MKELAREIVKCKKCDLYKSCTQKVIGRGSTTPEIVFIGEAPGAQEDKQGAPFVGKSGQLLNKWIDFLGVEEYAVINILKCRPPANRDPTQQEVEACREWLDKQLNFLNPKFVVAVGRFAMKELTGSDQGILNKAGTLVNARGYKTFIIPHPSYFLRNGGHGWEQAITKIRNEIVKHENVSLADGKTDAPYVPLHVHTEYSIGDGAGRIEDNLKYAKDAGFKSVAITDHGTLGGLYKFQKVCQDLGIKPILGCEFYVTDTYEVRSAERDHLVILAKNKEGLQNLFKLNSIAHEVGFYYKSLITLDDVCKYSEGLVVLSACTGGVIANRILKGEIDKAVETARLLYSIFGDDFYIELQPHYFEDQLIVNPALIELSKLLGIKTVVTTDVHYANPGKKELHNAVKAITFHKKFGEANFDGDTHCFLTGEQLFDALLKVDVPPKIIKESFTNTFEIAEKCNALIEPYDLLIPEVEIDADEVLRKLCEDSLKERKLSVEYADRLEYELGIIKSKKYANYFLIVRDYIKQSRNQGIMVGPGRGSAAGSLICYLLDITQIDPLKYGLIFERFLSPARQDPPDIDTDFQSSRREEIIGYLKKEYGEECTSQIPTLVRFGVKSGIRDLARIFSVPIAEVNYITKKIPDQIPDEMAYEIPEVKKFLNKYPAINDFLSQIIGSIRNRSVHAGGVVITPGPIRQYISQEKLKNTMCTCFDKDLLEEIGIVKNDILGLRSLDVIQEAMKMIGGDVVLPLEPNDPKVYEIFQKGLLLGVFQFETESLTAFARRVGIDNFEKLSDTTTIVRPAALHSGQAEAYIRRIRGTEDVKFLHPMLEPILKNTQGLILYQEQIMQIVNKLGGLSLAEANKIRKLVSKSKGQDALDKYMQQFISGCVNNGIDNITAQKIWDIIRKAGGYGFNFSHAVAYSMVSYWCAWLKTYYPKEFLTALMVYEEDDILSRAIMESREHGFSVLVPHINDSGAGAKINPEGEIILGLSDVDHVGAKALENLLKNQPYESFDDFFERRDTRTVNVRVIRNLIMAGAFDSFGARDELYYIVTPDEVPKKWDEKEMLLRQVDVLDLPPANPLVEFFENPYEDYVEMTEIYALDFDETAEEVFIKGVVSGSKMKQGYGYLSVNDGTSTVSISLSEETIRLYKDVIDAGIGTPVFIKGHIRAGTTRLYGDVLIDLRDIKEDSIEHKYLINGRVDVVKSLGVMSRSERIGTVVCASYFSSKKGNRGCWVTFKDGEKFMNFEHLDEPLRPGEVLVYTVSNPFFRIVKRF